MRKIVWISAILFCCAGCYGRPETDVRLERSEATLGCKMTAVSVMKKEFQYPLFEFSGWSRGIPRIFNLRAEIYLYDLTTHVLRRAAVIRPPVGLEQQFTVSLGWWDHDGLYLVYSGCPKKNKDSYCQLRYSYRKLLANGRIISVKEIPPPTQEISDGYKQCTTYIQDNKITIGPNGGPWQEILHLDEHKKLTVSLRSG